MLYNNTNKVMKIYLREYAYYLKSCSLENYFFTLENYNFRLSSMA